MPRAALHRAATVSAVAVGLLAVPVAVSAHPAFNPNELPPGEAVESTLVVPHGCAPGGGMPEASEDNGEVEPTVELALQHTDGVTVEPGDVEGWAVTDDGEAWVWSDDGGATTDVIELPVTLTVDEAVAAGDEIYLRAFQECADGSAFQWVGTPDDEASFPAVLLAATDSGVGTAEPDDSVNMDHGDMEMEEDELADGTDPGDATDTADGDEMETTDDDGEDEIATDEAATDETATAEAATDDGGLSPVLVALALIVMLVVVAGFVLQRRSS